MNNRFLYSLASLSLFILFQTPICFAEEPLVNSALAAQNITQLKEALTHYQSAALKPWPHFPKSTLIKLENKKHSVLLLRECLQLTGDLTPENNLGTSTYDPLLGQAVKTFQLRHGLKTDGVVGINTTTELNVPPQKRIQQIQINLKRWEGLAQQFGNRFIMVNIPDFHMYLFEDNQQVLSMKAIVGKEELPTPELVSRITRVVLNPPWNIPPRIAERDIIPKVLHDQNYLAEMNIRVLREDDWDDGSIGEQINPENIDWESAAHNGLNYRLRQDPGPQNSLGLVKFEFQNSHNVYLHDTPAKSLFDTDARDLSHGCVRLERPFDLVTYLMKDNEKWDDNTLQDIIDQGDTKYIKIKRPIPIFITYLTAWVDTDGRVNFRDDVYNLDTLPAN